MSGGAADDAAYGPLEVVALGVAVLEIVVLLALRVCTDAYYVANRRPERTGAGWNAVELPTAAAAYARDAGLEGPVLNHLNFGGYLMWALRTPVFVDARTEVGVTVAQIFTSFLLREFGDDVFSIERVNFFDAITDLARASS